MVSFSPETWALLLSVSAFMVIAMLYTLAAAVREQVKLHELKCRVHELHEEYTSRLAAMRERARTLEALEGGTSGATVEGSFDFVEDEPNQRAA